MSILVYQDKSVGLAAGLNWSVLTSEADAAGRVSARIRKQAGLVGASHHAVNTLARTRYLGLYTPPALSTAKPPKRIYSLALAFIQAFKGIDRSSINAILLMTPAHDNERRALVIIEGGQVVWDRLDKIDEVSSKAQATLSIPGIRYSVYSDRLEQLGAEVEPVTWDQMLAYTDGASELKSIPTNYAVIGAIAAVVLAVGAYAAYHYTVVAPAQEQAKRLAQQAAQNQTPQYLQRLDAELAHVGWQKADLRDSLAQIGHQKAYVQGWVLEQITCDADKQACEYRFSRLGGEVAELIAIESDKKYDNLASTKDLAIFSKSIKVGVQGMQRSALPDLESASVELRTRIQRLANAGATVSTTPTASWPTVGLDMSKVDKKVVAKQTGFEAKFPYPLADSVLNELPNHLALRNYTLMIAVGSDKANSLSLSLKGHSYAK